MFGIGKKQSTNIKVAEENPTLLPDRRTIDIVNDSLVHIETLMGNNELMHQEILAQVIGEDEINPIGMFSQGKVMQLKEHGFNIFIGQKFVMQFPYAAGINGNVTVASYDQDYNGRIVDGARHFRILNRIQYIGDIPDSCIYKYKTLWNDFNIRHFSVHSCSPLQVRRGTKIDPIMIAWANDPVIYINSKGKVDCCSKYCLGILVSVWDGDKEEI
jgi:hypothetical protein